MTGAESNVAVGMAQLGCRTRWVSRLDDDPLGRLLEEEITGRGVGVAVERDGSFPTGVLTKHVTGTTAVMRYSRSESAARSLSVHDLERIPMADRIHVTRRDIVREALTEIGGLTGLLASSDPADRSLFCGAVRVSGTVEPQVNRLIPTTHPVGHMVRVGGGLELRKGGRP